MRTLLLSLTLLVVLSSCSKPKPIRIAYVATLSGKNSELGIGGRTGIRLAVSQWNKKDGINGRPIELLIFNDKGNTVDGMALIDSLKTHGVSLVVGPLTSNMKPVVEAGMKEGILYVSPTMSSSSLSIKDDLFIRFIGPSSYQSELLGDDMVRCNIKTALVLIDERNAEYTNDIYTNLLSYINKKGLPITISKEKLNIGNPQRFTELTNLVTQNKPDAVLVVSSGIDFGITAQHLKKSPHQFKLMGARWSATHDMISHGGKAVEDAHLVGSVPGKIQSEAEQQFIEHFRSIHNSSPSFIPFFVYDAAHNLFSILQKTEDHSPVAVRDAFIAQGEFEGLQSSISMDSLGDVHRNIIQMITIKDGNMIPWP